MPKNGSGPSEPKPSPKQLVALRHYVICGRNAARTKREHNHSDGHIRRLAKQFPAEVDRLELEYEADRRQDEREVQDRARAIQRDVDGAVAKLMPRVLERLEELLQTDDVSETLRVIRLVCDLRTKIVPLPPEPDAVTRQAIRRLQGDHDVAL